MGVYGGLKYETIGGNKGPDIMKLDHQNVLLLHPETLKMHWDHFVQIN